MNGSRSALERLLSDMRRELRPLGGRARRRVLEEVRDHVLSAVEAGLDEAEAVARVGQPRVVLAGLPARRRTHRAAVVAVPVAFLALAAPVSGPLVQNLGAGATVSQASTLGFAQQQLLARERCVQAWNAPASGRWRALARRSGAVRAYVGVGYVTGRGWPISKARLRVASCGVNLKLARVASPYQPSISVFARKARNSFGFYRTLRVHSRSASATENARVDASGRLTLSMHPLPPICPRERIGSGIQSVVAGPQRKVLARGSETSLGRRVHSFVVAIRNDGKVAIQGAIASLELYPSADAHRPSWRSKPVTISRLQPGELIAVPFATPALGNTTRLVRATTAAIACETRVGDNSRLYPINSS
jgi:hypothetical protein